MTKTFIDPLQDGISKIELIRASGSDLDVANAARVSFGGWNQTFTEKDEKLIRYLIKHEHTSPFEHNQLSYRIKVPIYIIRQWMRHRVGVSYNEISGRYAELPMDFYVPKSWRTQDLSNKQGSVEALGETDTKNREAYIKSLETAKDSYKKLLAEGVCRELARGVLPLCTYTEFIFTCNLVSLFHFVRLRSDHHAQWEIQQYAVGLLELAQEHFPTSIKNWAKLKGIELKQIEKGTTINTNIESRSTQIL
ncbi:FAD-dependent thymidylate synthase [Candidatus Babeliales bacterium]|nr:FAD-dependent thymidylate synthase [Candidatus Babeliales bacterium]